MERKIGEIFEYNGEWYQCVEDTEYISCINCCFYNEGHKLCTDEDMGACAKEYRSDAKPICFKKLEKVGEPYKYNPRIDILFQCYKLQNTDYTINCNGLVVIRYYDGTIGIEIKQNKEDMEKKKLNLKPFDLEAAKAGKPVCTRDGRKARIICFDAKGDKPIIALIEMGVAETPNNYPIDGKAISTKETPCDLMMLSEKKEGWVNIYRTQIYTTLEKAEKAYRIAGGDNYLETIKVEWEE